MATGNHPRPSNGAVRRALAILRRNDGAVLYWQVDANIFTYAERMGAIRFDPQTDLYVHPRARALDDGAYTMAAA